MTKFKHIFVAKIERKDLLPTKSTTFFTFEYPKTSGIAFAQAISSETIYLASRKFYDIGIQPKRSLNPDSPFIAFWNLVLLSLLFGEHFLFCSKDVEGSAERNTLAF